MIKRDLVVARPSDAARRWRSLKVTRRELVNERPSNVARRWRSSTVTKRELVDARTSNAARCCQKMAKLEGDETRSRGCKSCKYPTPPCALAKCYPRPPCAPSFVKSRMLCSQQTHFLLFQQMFFVLVCIHPGNATVPLREAIKPISPLENWPSFVRFRLTHCSGPKWTRTRKLNMKYH